MAPAFPLPVRVRATLDRFTTGRRGDELFRARLLVAGSLLSIPLGLLNAPLLARASHSNSVGWMTLSWAAVGVLGLLCARAGVSSRILGLGLGLVVYITMAVFREATGGFESPAWTAVVTIPVVVTFFSGIGWGAGATGAVVLEGIGYSLARIPGLPVGGGEEAWFQVVILLDAAFWMFLLVSLYEASRRRALEELQTATLGLLRADRLAATGRLAAELTHEISNPIQAVMGAADSLRLDLTTAADTDGLDPGVAECLSYLDRAAKQAAGVVDALASYVRVEPGGFVALDLAEPARRAAALTAYRFGRDGVDLRLELDTPLPAVGSADRMEQVFVNLLMNAVDACKPVGSVVIRAAAGKREVRVEVIDDGLGLSQEQKGRLFEPFFTTKPTGQGTGLGLSICEGLVTEHRGRIEVSSAPGGGTVFAVILPRAGRARPG